MKDKVNHFKNGHHLNSRYWRNYKKTLPVLPDELVEIAIGMILGDAHICKINKEAFIRFEQGYKQQAFLEHLFDKFSLYSHMEEPSKRFINQNKLSSFWFKTFSHPSFTKIFLLFYTNLTSVPGILPETLVTTEDKVQKQVYFSSSYSSSYKKKTITPICDYLTARGLAYWIMCDGSLQRYNKSLILHTQGFSQEENNILSNELNLKFKLCTRVIPHNHKKKNTVVRYFVIFIPTEDLMANLITPYIIPSMKYKIPQP